MRARRGDNAHGKMDRVDDGRRELSADGCREA
jgi:hypothetical protein